MVEQAESFLRKVSTKTRKKNKWPPRIALAACIPMLLVPVAHAADLKTPSFEKDILPIFQKNCLRCHDEKVKSGGLDISTLKAITAGSASGPVILAKQPDASKLYSMVHDGMMPLDRKTTVSGTDLELIRAWIASQDIGKTENLPAAPVTEYDIIPIMLRHCTSCHGLRHQDGGLALSTRASMLAGGNSGPALVLGKPEKSLMLQRVLSEEMPPKGAFDAGASPLSEDEIKKLTAWIAAGAPKGTVQPDVAGSVPDTLVSDHDRKFWAFQPPRPPLLPSVQHQDRVRNPIDAFILQKLEAKGLTLSPETDRPTLIRRVYFDLTGLPPRPEDVQRFLADKDSKAYERLVDRLLDSPHYGERWGRYWLDLAGYADTEERDSGLRRAAWRYRDYVIRAFNADKPYNRFLLEQIAGDELADYESAPVITQELMDNLIATGFLRLAVDPTGTFNMNLLQDRVNVISDEIEIFSTGVLGLTVQCAQCHDHKLEPIPQRDYYRLRAVFKGALDEYDWLPPFQGENTKPPLRQLPYVPPLTNPIALAEQEDFRKSVNAKLQAQIKSLEAQLENVNKPLAKQLVQERLAKMPPELRDDLRVMLATPPEKRDDRQKYLAERFEQPLTYFAPGEVEGKMGPNEEKIAEDIQKKVLVLRSQQIPEPYIRALWDRGDPSPTYIYRRGDYQNPGRLVGPGVPSVLTDGKTPFAVTPPWPGAHKTGARLALARRLVAPDNPLTARVWVNRIWQHHFGKGIVATVGNFGLSGDRPTHPELLDWLALQLVNSDWSTKTLQKLILTSSAYRQSSTVTPAAQKLDHDNVLISRMPMLRLDAEALRDSIVFIAGRLNSTQFGPPDPLHVRPDGLVSVPESPSGWRRSIYAQQFRQNVLTSLNLFDYPQMGPNCVQRVNTGVAPQALYLENDAMVRQLADVLAKRVQAEAGDDLAKQIDRVYWIALSRPPTAEESALVFKTLQSELNNQRDRPGRREQVMARFCLTIINSAGFIYVD